jgi:transcriptional regulator GlxA family with amidase domain
MADQGSTANDRSLHSVNARRALERAREYIEAQLSATIRVASICSYARTTLRTLNRSFRQELGMSPQEYVKVRRLNRVRRQLLVVDCEQSARVTDVAMQHGFTHLGRFAGEYRRYFGESPRETLPTR